MAIKTKCQTPGVVFHTTINSNKVDVSLVFTKELDLTKKEATLLEANIHNALELVFSRYFHVNNK